MIIFVIDTAHIVSGTGSMLCNGRVPVCPSICLVDRQQQPRAAGLLLSAGVSRYPSAAAGTAYQLSIDLCWKHLRPAANGGSVLLSRGTLFYVILNKKLCGVRRRVSCVSLSGRVQHWESALRRDVSLLQTVIWRRT